MARTTILAAPGLGMIHGTAGATESLLYDRRANGCAQRGERLVRVPRRMVRDYHGRWLVGQGKLQDASRRSVRP